MAKSKQTYDEAIKELNAIIAELENNPEINMALISEKVKRATALLAICKKQLHEIDTELEHLLEKL